MKKSIVLMIILSIISLTSVYAVSKAVGSIDNECQANGFDFGVAKYECPDTDPSEENVAGTSIEWVVVIDENQNPECVSVDWEADPAVAGVLTKEGTTTFTSAGGTSGTVEMMGQNSISHITFCGESNEIPEFTTIGAGLALAGAGLYMYRKRRK